MSVDTQLIENIESISRCNICLDFFNDKVTLFCGHSYCRGCICHNDMMKKCPLCRREFIMIMDFYDPDSEKQKNYQSLNDIIENF